MALNIAQIQGSMPSALDQVLGGFQAGTNIRQQRLQEAQQAATTEAAEQRKLQIQQALSGLGQNPSATATDYAQVGLQFPELAENLKSNFELMDTERQEATRSRALNVFAALDAGQTDMAKEMLETDLEAAENSGDERAAAGAKAQLQILEMNPDAAKTSAGLFLSSAFGPEEFESVLSGLQERDIATELAPVQLKKAAADLGLTEATTNKVLAETANLGVETKRKVLELEALKQGNEEIPREKKFAFEKDLRADYNKLTGEFFKVQDAYRRVKAAEENAAGDLALIFSFMKMLDPGSVVREGEFANAQNAAGIPDRIKNQYNKLMSGERLGAPQRKAFIGQTESLYKAAKVREKDVREQLAPAIRNYDLNADNVWGEESTADLSQLSDEELDAQIAAAQGG